MAYPVHVADNKMVCLPLVHSKHHLKPHNRPRDDYKSVWEAVSFDNRLLDHQVQLKYRLPPNVPDSPANQPLGDAADSIRNNSNFCQCHSDPKNVYFFCCWYCCQWDLCEMSSRKRCQGWGNWIFRYIYICRNFWGGQVGTRWVRGLLLCHQAYRGDSQDRNLPVLVSNHTHRPAYKDFIQKKK